MTLLAFLVAGILVLASLALLASHVFSRQVAAKVRSAMPPRGQLQAVPGGEIHYVEKGEGPPLLLIHGLSGNLYNFTYASFEPLTDHYRVIAIDRPGCGHSTRETDELARLPEQARLVAEFIQAKGLEKPLVVGHSLGGAVSLALALDHPERVGGLALISPLTALQTEAPAVFNGLKAPSPALRSTIAHTLAIPSMIRNGAKVVGTIFHPDAAPEDFRERGGGLLSLRPEAYYAASTDMHAVPLDIEALQARYGEINLPVGVLYGDQDAVLRYDLHTNALKDALPGIHVEIIEGGGHMPLVVHADRTLDFIRYMARSMDEDASTTQSEPA